jgi:phosphate transport system ATP-binding protein
MILPNQWLEVSYFQIVIWIWSQDRNISVLASELRLHRFNSTFAHRSVVFAKPSNSPSLINDMSSSNADWALTSVATNNPKATSQGRVSDSVEEAPATAEASKFLEVEDYSFFYGQKQALFDVNMARPEKQIAAFIGPSGCGKTTLLRNFNRMNDLIAHTSHTGDIRLKEQSLYDPKLDILDLRFKIGMVFQKPNPFPKSIFDNVIFSLRMAGERNRNVLNEVVETSLRGAVLCGQLQRLCIARAIANRPEVLLMDEPCAALDPIATAKVEELMLNLAKDYTVVIVTHNMQQAARVADRTAFFFMGRLIEYNLSTVIFENPKQKQTEDYISGRFG